MGHGVFGHFFEPVFMMETIQNRPTSNGVTGWECVTSRVVRDHLLKATEKLLNRGSCAAERSCNE